MKELGENVPDAPPTSAPVCELVCDVDDPLPYLCTLSSIFCYITQQADSKQRAPHPGSVPPWMQQAPPGPHQMMHGPGGPPFMMMHPGGKKEGEKREIVLFLC